MSGVTRRRFLGAASVAILGGAALARLRRERRPALVAVSFDLEMSRNFPAWEDTHWDYAKGNLDAETKRYAVEAATRLKDAGGSLHCFAVGRTLEQENVDWLKGMVKDGHPVGNHTYDHVNVLARKLEEIQYRFQRAPWLIEGRKPADVIRDNIAMTTRAMKTRLDTSPSGFRTPGGFADGLNDRPDVQQMLLDLGFKWASCKYPAHRMSQAGKEPTKEIFDSIVEAQAKSQPYAYKSGLIEVPMSPVSDINAFRSGRWKLDWFLEAIRRALAWTIDNGATFDFLGHPSCLHVVDPKWKTIELISEVVKKAGDRASLVNLDTIARRAGKKQ